jgi:hypothetical protein
MLELGMRFIHYSPDRLDLSCRGIIKLCRIFCLTRLTTIGFARFD